MTSPQQSPAAASDETDARRQLQIQKMESMCTMSAGIAHDMNNYLAAILGNNTVMQRSPSLDTRAKECGQRIESAGNLALHLSEQLATYSARIEHNPVELDLQELVDAVRTATSGILSRGIGLDFEIAPNCPPLYADPAQLQRVLVNLITNAIESMVDRQGVIHVFLRPYQPAPSDADLSFFSLLTDGAWFELAVKDAGHGIPLKFRDRIFDPFFSTKIRGRGMGLPETLGIVRLHNGNIIVKSQPGAGTTLRILLPVPPDAALGATD